LFISSLTEASASRIINAKKEPEGMRKKKNKKCNNRKVKQHTYPLLYLRVEEKSESSTAERGLLPKRKSEKKQERNKQKNMAHQRLQISGKKT